MLQLPIIISFILFFKHRIAFLPILEYNTYCVYLITG